MFQAIQVAGLVLWITGAAWAQDLDPHQPTDAGLVLAGMSVDAQVEVGMAVVSVRQDFHNPYADTIDAVYTFPLPEDAAVRSMLLTCGDLTIEGEIMEKDAAREAYEQARHEGRRASLLEQERSNVFTQHVAGLCPGETVTVDLEYVHQVDYKDSTYTLSFPTTVGGPYFNVPSDLKLPPLVTTKTRPTPDFEMSVDIRGRASLESIWSDTHAINIDEGDWGTHVELTEQQVRRDRDVVMSWTLAGRQPRVAVVTSPGDDKGGYVAVTIEPQILADVAGQQKRELLFVLDESCSMSGQPFEAAQQTVRLALEQMGHRDTFNLVRFSDGADSLFPEPVPTTEANIDAANEWLNDFGSGGTEMKAGVLHSLNMPGDPSALRLVLMLTDGYIGNDGEILDAVRDNLGNSRLFSLGVGSSVNRMLLEGLAEMGRGQVAYKLPGTPIEELVDTFYSRIAHPSMTDVTVDFGGLDVFDQYPAVIPDLWAGIPVRVVARFRGGGDHHLITVSGDVRGEPYRLRLPMNEDEGAVHEGVKTLWARSRIHDLAYDRYLDPIERANGITATALEYHLVSDYTSLVAAEKTPSTCGSASSEVEVPNLTPYGVEPPINRQRIEVDFEGVDVQGELVKPVGQLVLDRRKASMNPLVRLRSGFDSEISASANGGEMSSFSEIEFSGAADDADPLRDGVHMMLHRLRNQLRACYSKRLKVNPALTTRIELAWRIEDGKAVDFEILGGDEDLARCIISLLKRQKWEEFEGDLTWPFIFRPG